MAESVKITKSGLASLEDELRMLVTVKRREIAEHIKQARGFGDLSENSEYDEAKNEQAVVEARIAHIEEILRNIEVIDADKMKDGRVHVGSKLTLVYIDDGEQDDYQLVGNTEADPINNRISYESPMGKALLGASLGDTVSVEAPDGTFEVKILNIY